MKARSDKSHTVANDSVCHSATAGTILNDPDAGTINRLN